MCSYMTLQGLKAVAANVANAARFISSSKAEAKTNPSAPSAPSVGHQLKSPMEYGWEPQENWENMLHIPDEDVPVDK